jgi:hypothetical protein
VGTTVTLAERWNGSGWAIQATPNPGGATNSYLNGVSCTSTKACTAVGLYIDSASTIVTLAERWNGGGWAIQATPNPSGATESQLLSVSCTSATACTAAGNYTSAGTGLTLAEDWDGTSWAIHTSPSPSGATYSSLYGVSCTSATACTSVGFYDDSTGTAVLLAEGGTSWVIVATPNPTGAGGSNLSGVSCTSAKACTAVGNYINSGGTNVTLAERWKGTGWAIQATPNHNGATTSALRGVSCTSAAACTAVGYYINSAGTYLTLAEGWNGTNWTIQATPNHSGATTSALVGASCTSATACTAVGFYVNSAGTDVTLAETWNGTSWMIQATPNPSGATGSLLLGVSCTSATACTAVGEYDNSAGTYVTLAERWDGTAWKIQPTPNPSGATVSALTGVSCTSATGCTAVGYDFNNVCTQCTLAEHWNGTSWAIQPSPSIGLTNSVLQSVSCTSTAACMAVGYYDSAGTELTLAEHWDGTGWTIQPTSNPSGATASYLPGVSCTSATTCLAVGYYLDGAGTQLTLAET